MEFMRHQTLCHRFLNGTILPWKFERGGQMVRISPSVQLIANSLEL
jgi:hypothetical protein